MSLDEDALQVQGSAIVRCQGNLDGHLGSWSVLYHSQDWRRKDILGKSRVPSNVPNLKKGGIVIANTTRSHELTKSYNVITSFIYLTTEQADILQNKLRTLLKKEQKDCIEKLAHRYRLASRCLSSHNTQHRSLYFLSLLVFALVQ